MMTPEQRTEHCRRIAPHGGAVTASRYPSAHFRAIGKAGYQATKERHGVAYVKGILGRRRWHGRRQDSPAIDLAAGAFYADY